MRPKRTGRIDLSSTLLHPPSPTLPPLKQPNPPKHHPNRREKPQPNPPPHPRLLGHPQHAVHSPAQAHPCIVEGVVHGIGQCGGVADFVADG